MSLLGAMVGTEYGCAVVLICVLMMISAGVMVVDSGGPVDKNDLSVDKDEEAKIKDQLTERED